MLEQRYSDNNESKRDIPSFIEPRPPLIQNPFMRPKPQKGTNLLELFEEDSDIEEPELVQVYLRLKPCKIPNTLYEIRSDKCLVTSLDTATAGHGRRTQHNVSKMYTFSKIFGSECNQKDIFEQVVKDNLKKLPEGHNFTLLTYGASGSGKTYTLMGTVGSPGLVPRSLEYVFKLVDAAQLPVYKPAENGAEQLNYAEQDYELQWVKRLRHVSAPLRDKYRRMSVQLHSDLTVSSIDLSNRVRHYVWVSFVEIYNEAIYDLLAPPEKRIKLRIREDSSGNVYVKGATQAFVRSGEEAYDVMVAGKHNLIVAATGVHAHSSRSHCIFTITMLTETGEGGVRSACVRLCDLAGCERARATRNTGARMLESRAINSSLHVLERCLHMLRRKQRTRHDALVPYRESKLTRLLGTGLSGAKGEAVSMVVTLNPSVEYAHETKHVLSLAAVAQDIQINNTMLVTTTLESSTQDTTISCSSEVMKLRSDNERLHFELVQAQARNKELMASMEERQQETANTMRELVEEAKDMTRQYYVAQLEALRAEMDEMAEEYEARLAKASKEVPPSGSGTPSRFLQSKVDQLMTEIAILQEKLTAERLARSRAEKEVQHLRTCIEERDEKAFKDTTPPQEVMDLSDSEHESDEDTSDPLNESLEPIFRKELNKSMAKQNDTVSIHTIDNIDEENEDVDDDVHENTTQVNDTKDSTIVDENEITHNSKCDDITEINSANSTYESAKIYSIDKKSESLNDPDEDSIKTIQDKVNDLSVNDNIKMDSLKSSICRGTYFVRDTKDNAGDFGKDPEEKSISSCRSTYFVSSHAADIHQNTESNDKDVTFEHFKEPVIDKPTTKVTAKVSETLVSKIINSLKSNHGNDSSLTQFEQLEIASKKFDEDAGKTSFDSTDINMLKEKKTYFDNEPSKSTVNNTDEISNVLSKEKRTFFDNIDVNMQASSKKIDSIKIIDEERSPSIVKENLISETFEPSKIKKLLGESFSKPEIMTSIRKTRIAKKHESVDLFESPVVITNEKHENNIDMVKQSIDRLVLSQQSAKKGANHDIKLTSPRKEELHTSPVRLNNGRSPIRVDIIRSPMKHDITKSPAKNDTAKARLDVARSPLKYDLAKSSVKSDTAKSPIRLDFGRTPINSDTSKSPVTNDTDKYHKKKDTVELPIEREISNSHMRDIQKPMKMSEYNKLKQNDFVRSLLNKDDALTQVPTKTETIIDPHLKIKQEKDLILTSLTLQKSIITNIKKEVLDPVSTDEANVTTNETNDATQDNTAELFENIYKDITAPRATEFELLVSQSSDETNDKNEKETAKYNLRKKNDDSKSDKDNIEISDKVLESAVKPSKSDDNKINKDKITFNDEILLESQDKCESKPRKRTLRLRRKKNQGDDDSSDKLKDIVNLQTEFSDVTMGVPVAQKVVKDIPSPEKGAENLPPILGIQSCPAKSITRSRRKLFTPRAEPLEESLTQAGDSNERIYVPRPSYHRPRARRKL